jgi:hypothetical protein
VEFAGVGSFIDQPVKTYSSGMYVRLGFAVAVAVDPDVLLIDEVLAVGDEAFVRRCFDRLAWMRQRGVTMVLVSHDLDLVGRFADRAVYLNQGRVVVDGTSDAAVARYRSDVAGEETLADDTARGVRVVEEGRRSMCSAPTRESDRRCCRRVGRAPYTCAIECTRWSMTSCSAWRGIASTVGWWAGTTPTSTVRALGGWSGTARFVASTRSWISLPGTTFSTPPCTHATASRTITGATRPACT